MIYYMHVCAFFVSFVRSIGMHLLHLFR